MVIENILSAKTFIYFYINVQCNAFVWLIFSSSAYIAFTHFPSLCLQRDQVMIHIVFHPWVSVTKPLTGTVCRHIIIPSGKIPISSFYSSCHLYRLVEILLFFLIKHGTEPHSIFVLMELLLHLTALDPHLHETTLGRNMKHSGTGRYGQNEFMNMGILPFCLLLSAFISFVTFSHEKWAKWSFPYWLARNDLTTHCSGFHRLSEIALWNSHYRYKNPYSSIKVFFISGLLCFPIMWF